MGTKQDWKNVEITLYWRIKDTINDPNKTKHMGFSARGGPHHSSGGIWGIDPCCGTALYVGLTFSGKPGVAKELRHADYTDDLYIDSVTDGDLRDRWIGMKGIFYTKANGNPYIELWLDKKANNNWELILQKEDAGGWSIQDDNGNPTSNKCGGAPDEQITWGGPGIIFKLDGLTRVDMKWGSVREIMPPEGWPLRYLLHTRGVSFPVSMRSMAEEYGLTAPIFLRELTESEAERPRD